MQNFTVSEHEKLNTAVALGFFDGLHKGHRRVILSAVEQKKNGLLPVCFTFAQSPKEVLGKSSKGALMTTEDKLKTLERLGIEHTFSPDFKKLMNMSAKDFVEKIIFGNLNAKFVVCGFNYRFGKNGEGDTELLKKLCDENGTELNVIEPERDGGDVVSSTLIRLLVSEGRIRRANKLLCSYFGFSAVITHGKRLGRELGTPTINQNLPENLAVPKYGVYASAVTLENGKVYCGVTNIGVKPTVGGTTLLSETWMPDFHGGEIYGQTADVRLLDFIRPEKKFDNITELKNAITDNAVTAKEIFGEMYRCGV